LIKCIEMNKVIHLTTTIPEDLAGKRLDQALAILFHDHSRVRLQEWIRGGEVRINHQTASQRQRVKGGEHIEIKASFKLQADSVAEDIPLQIIHEDEQFLIVNKPPGLVVHPGAGNREHTLLNALLHYDPKLEIVPRAGIVHRLDKDTSGVMIVARTPEVHTSLVAQLQAREIKREYQAIVTGVMTAGGSVDQPIGRHPGKRTQMAVVEHGKAAVTHFRIIKKFRAHTHIRLQLESGRTHQIRVHMAWLKYPIVGDPVYARRAHLPKGASQQLIDMLQTFPRQALHACAITLQHPQTDEILICEAPLPEDMQQLLDVLKKDATGS